jgi:hypothetical protein
LCWFVDQAVDGLGENAILAMKLKKMMPGQVRIMIVYTK